MNHKIITGCFVKGETKDRFIMKTKCVSKPNFINSQTFVPFYEVIVYSKNEIDNFNLTTTIYKFEEQTLMKSLQSSQFFLNNLQEKKRVNKCDTVEYELYLVSMSSIGDVVKYLLVDKKGLDVKRGKDFEEYLLSKIDSKNE